MNSLIREVRIEYGEEVAREVASILRVVRTKIVAKNLFGRSEFMDDVLVDLVAYMIRTEFQYSGGAYVACGMQAAIDACRYCNAQKRRGEYETVSIYKVERFVGEQPSEDYVADMQDMLKDIATMLGTKVAEELESYLTGAKKKLSADVVEKCKTEEFKIWLKTYRR